MSVSDHDISEGGTKSDERLPRLMEHIASASDSGGGEEKYCRNRKKTRTKREIAGIHGIRGEKGRGPRYGQAHFSW